MNILFLTIYRITSISERNIYTDLIRKFGDEGHRVCVVTPAERRYREDTGLIYDEGVGILRIKTLNFQKINIIEKGIATLLFEQQYKSGIIKYLNDTTFDLVVYSTPPITFTGVIKWIKKRDHATSYLLLKDIFPQNAVDLGMMEKKGLIHRFFRRKEKQLYAVSDLIGCMSPANVSYLLKHNPELSESKVEVCPNSIAPVDFNRDYSTRTDIRNRYQIPQDALVVVYGGNLGKPQGLDFLPEILDTNRNRKDYYFLIVGSGTEKPKIEEWLRESKVENCRLISSLPKNEYDELVKACDVGLIMLDKRFTIPNFPSRLLSYLEFKMPVLIATDLNCDMGTIAENYKFGLFSLHGDLKAFNQNLEKFLDNRSLVEEMGLNGYQYLMKHYTVDQSYQIIMQHFHL